MKKSLLLILATALLSLTACTATPETQRDASSTSGTCERATGSNMCRR